MTHEELDTIEDNLRKVDKFSPGGYGIVTALELVAELRKLLPLAAVDEAQSQLDALAIGLNCDHNAEA